MDSHQVPTKYFEYFIGKTNLQVNSAQDIGHEEQTSYQSVSRKISYKIFDPEGFFNALEESEVILSTAVLFSGNVVCGEQTSTTTTFCRGGNCKSQAEGSSATAEEKAFLKINTCSWSWGRVDLTRNRTDMGARFIFIDRPWTIGCKDVC